MSTIDQYKHKLLGFIECPSKFDFVYENLTRKIAIYELKEDLKSDDKEFNGKIGDIIIGGGSGEAAIFRISIPESLNFFFEDNWDDFETYDELFKAYWNPTESFIFCEGYLKLGWSIKTPIELWLAENLCLLLIEHNIVSFKTNSLAKSKLMFFDSI